MKKTDRFWIITVGLVLLASALAVAAVRGEAADTAHIYSDGRLVASIKLSEADEPYSFTVDAGGGGRNVISAEGGRIRVSDADCPDVSCVRRGWISGGEPPIICLPHRLVIELSGAGGRDVDAVASLGARRGNGAE